jgi:hypothetical protein
MPCGSASNQTFSFPTKKKQFHSVSFDQNFLSPLIKGARGLLKEKFGRKSLIKKKRRGNFSLQWLLRA